MRFAAIIYKTSSSFVKTSADLLRAKFHNKAFNDHGQRFFLMLIFFLDQ